MEDTMEAAPGSGFTLAQAAAFARPARVLVAEDDQEMRSLIVSSLRRDGYDVVESETGDALLEEIGDELLRAHAVRPDLIVSDIRMPGSSGLDVLSGLRRAAWETPVILITAFGDDDTHKKAKRLGASAVFDKPFDVDDLRTAVMVTLMRDRPQRTRGPR
jgi:DNA-binding response OmpR family regulator